MLERGERERAAAHPFDCVAGARQRVLDARAEELVVLYEKKAHGAEDKPI